MPMSMGSALAGSSRMCRLKSWPGTPPAAGAGRLTRAGGARSRSARWARRLRRDPNDVEALYGYFDALVEESGTLRALEALEAWGRQTGAPSADLVVGYCLFGLGRNGEAVERFRRAHRARPREPTLYALSCALTVTGNAAESRRLLGAASRGRRLTARLLVSLADAHLAEGRPAAAESAPHRITPRGASDWSELVESAWERVRRARAAREAG